MSEEKAVCRVCGSDLEGRDVYEGICKVCREELVLGAPRGRGKKPKPREAEPSRDDVPSDAIAIEPTVDHEADTKEMGGDEALADEAEPEEEEAAPPAPAPVGEDDVLSLDDVPPRAAPAGREPSAAAAPGVGRPDAPFLEFAKRAAAPAPREALPAAKPAGAERDFYAVEEEVEVSPARKLPGRSYTATRDTAPAPPAAAPTAPEAEAARPERITPRPAPDEQKAPSPAAEPPAAMPGPAADRKGIRLEGEQKPTPEPVAEPAPAAAAAELPSREEDIHEEPPRRPVRVKRPAEEAPPADAAEPAPKASRRVKLDTDSSEGRLRALLDEMASQVEQLSKVLALSREGRPGPVSFGFRAFFGFVLAMGVLAAVAVGLLALVGLLFYPPAFELLRRVFGAISGGQ